ncbi:nucleotide sugar dehydrogenase [Neptuniibacter caesariensis]|uniref:UDP-glucose 6-dehydrogenase n=1 Tax=Neptuniibacter caesariensis TaxID=207954 RepID=A0A7U8C1U0_NEPCE|nr:nucleotide sugar dehydrogenase [Neptuniibacter caesariensis]EAR59943.1 UDP-glucose 6-dehydrogenase [Oceanospirillum sp. MED92] [Neptuniibacter caesariensis]
MKVTIWGNELLAWTAAAALAESGNHVLLVTNEHEVPNEAETEFKVSNEPGLEQLITDSKACGRLKVGSDEEGVIHASNHILALNPDQFVTAERLVARLSQTHSSNLLIINQSNFGVGSSDRLQSQIGEANNQVICYIPDMLAEGSALQDYKWPQTYIIGCTNDWAMLNIKALFRPFSQAVKQWMIMTAKEAEFTKFANTGMLALRLGYINELANLADQLEVDIEVIREAMVTDPRIGPHYLHPGCGFGGLHFQQYIEALSELMSEARNSKLLDTVLTENEKQKEQPFRKLWRHYDCDLENRVVTIWGLSFKPGTASIDNAPSLKVINTLLAQNCRVQVHDPEAMGNIREHFGEQPNLAYFDNGYDSLKKSDGLLLLTDWPEYWSPDYDEILNQMKYPLIIDGRNIFDKEMLESLGFIYYGVGR